MASGALRRILFSRAASIALPPPPGGGGGGSVQWHAGTMHVDLVTDGSGLEIEDTVTGSWRSARANTALAGKQYMEFTVTFTGGVFIGIAETTFDNATFLSNGGTDAVGWSYNGQLWKPVGDTSLGTEGSFASGNIVSMAVDIPNGKVWWRVNGGTWRGNTGAADDPATNTGGLSLAPLAGDLFPAVSLLDNGDTVLANFGATAFTYTPPSGFSGMESPPPTQTAVWDATWTHADYTGGGTDTITKTGSSWRNAIASVAVPASSKKCWEIVFTGMSSHAMIGVGNKFDIDCLLSYAYGTNVHIQKEGTVWQYNASVGNNGIAYGNVVVGVYCDTVNNVIWLTLNNSTFYGLPGASSVTPATSATGEPFGAATGGAPFYPSASADGSGTGIKIRTTQSQFTVIGTPVSGYSALE